MGMFDRVWIACPKCGNAVEFQSKAGHCLLTDYTDTSAPQEMLRDIEGDVGYCEQCGSSVTIDLETTITIQKKTVARGRVVP